LNYVIAHEGHCLEIKNHYSSGLYEQGALPTTFYY
jgi:hypothetical protein